MSTMKILGIFVIAGVVLAIIGLDIGFSIRSRQAKIIAKALCLSGALIFLVSGIILAGMLGNYYDIKDIKTGCYQMVNIKEASEKYTEEVDAIAFALQETNSDTIEIIEGNEDNFIVKIESETLIVKKDTINSLISDEYLILCDKTLSTCPSCNSIIQ